MKNNQLKWGRYLFALLIVLMMAACKADAPTETTPEPTAVPTEVPTEVPTAEASLPAVDPTTGLIDPIGVPELEFITLEDAITTDSGLQYKENVAGEGDFPVEGDILTMEFMAYLSDGTPIASSVDQGEPIMALFGRDQLLPGWEEGVGMMKPGGEATLALPAALAFGEQGYGAIPPNAQLIIDLLLVSVEKPPVHAEVAEEDMIESLNGLLIYDMVPGEGEVASVSSIVETHFAMWVQGEEIDDFVVSSYGSTPLTFTIGDGVTVFPGWEAGMIGMKVGGKRLLVIPPELALADQGGNGIPPNATLIMEVELIKITPPPVQTEVDPDDYITTESGLMYYDIVVGEGPNPVTGELVVVNYSGWLEDGTMFDSSFNRGEPISFPIGTGSVIVGWDEGLATMKPGGIRQLVIPAELAYGETGSGAVIPPGATLIFDVELVAIGQ